MLRKCLHQALIVFFVASLIIPPDLHAQTLVLPVPGSMLALSKPYMPVMVKGLMVHPEHPFQFDFFVDSGDTGLKGEGLKAESMKLIKYFLAALTVPEDQMWVNLSPYEKDRMIPQTFGDTEMGRDLLAQDYILKQLTASLTYPEKEMGRAFWDKFYAEAQSKFGTTNVPVNTFNKVWIVPQKAGIYEHGNGAFVVESRLKVMLEEDYEALNKNNPSASSRGLGRETSTEDLSSRQKGVGIRDDAHKMASEIVRQIILPALEQEVNQGRHFANLRQIYQAMILATWYKIRLKEGILGKLYVDRNKTKGVALAAQDKQDNAKIYQQYLRAFKKGVYNYIKEDLDPATKMALPRKYVSGGYTALGVTRQVRASLAKGPDLAMVGEAMASHGDQAVVSWAANTSVPADRAMLAFQDIGKDPVEIAAVSRAGQYPGKMVQIKPDERPGGWVLTEESGKTRYDFVSRTAHDAFSYGPVVVITMSSDEKRSMEFRLLSDGPALTRLSANDFVRRKAVNSG